MRALSPSEIEELLGRVHHGRLGLESEGEIYVVPVGFAPDGPDLWFHSGPGRKAAALGERPSCCFEVDEYDPKTASWRSVIAWGEALPAASPTERAAGMAALKARFGHVLATVLRGGGEGPSAGQLYRFRPTRISGRTGP